jgi:alanine-glyoxylate transaminase / serine-glyoxylate transaminase / serine-pyruvate transaminase
LGPRAIQSLENRRSKVPNWYLDLTSVQKYWGKERTYHHTAPISNVFALYEALRIVAEESLEQRWARHRQVAEMFWSGLEAMGLACHVPEPSRLETLTTVRVPDGIDEVAVRQKLLNKYNIEISGGFGELKGKIWRVGLMGYSARPENVLLLLAALKDILSDR